MKKHFCDRCGQEIMLKKVTPFYWLTHNFVPHYVSLSWNEKISTDVCLDCMRDFRKWFEEGRK